MRTRLMLLLLVLSSACLVSACGTATFDHVVNVSIADPSRRLGNAPIEVGIFNKTSGQSEEWARRTMGVAGPGTPYTGTVWATDTKTLFDTSLPEHVEMGLSVPAYEATGYFIVSLQPVPGKDQRATASFAPKDQCPGRCGALRARDAHAPADRRRRTPRPLDRRGRAFA